MAMVFRVTGYDQDCDGSLMARLANVNADGEESGWEPHSMGLRSDDTWILERPDELDHQGGKP